MNKENIRSLDYARDDQQQKVGWAMPTSFKKWCAEHTLPSTMDSRLRGYDIEENR